MDGSKERPLMTAGLDIADKYSYPCALSIRTVARLWRKVCSAHYLRGLSTTLRLRAASSMRIAIEAATRSP
jgi:hypothetical protein